MKLLTEVSEQIEFLTEQQEGGSKDYYIEGIFMQTEIKNRNGRMYPKEMMIAEVNRYIKEAVKPKTAMAMGELNHPENPGINMDKVSHLITELRFDGNNVIGKAKILNTPNGNIVKGLMDEGITFGVSSRGIGSVKPKNGMQEVQNDFRLSTIDIVSDPSGPDCFVDGIMENVEWIYDEDHGYQAQKIIEKVKEEVHNGTQ